VTFAIRSTTGVEAVASRAPGDVVVGVDGSQPSQRALQWAIDEAQCRQVRCRVIKVLAPHALDVVDRENELRMFDFLADERTALSAMVAESVADVAVIPSTDVELMSGHPVERLAEAARQGDLLVVGSSGHGTVTGLFLGSVSSALLHRRVCPTVVVPPNTDRHAGHHRIVVGVDGTDGSARALQWAVHEAQRRDCELVVVHAWHVPVVLPSPYVPTMVIASEDCEQNGAEVLAHALLLVGPDADIVVTTHLVEGIADVELVAAAANADLVVVGGRGRAGLAAAVLGSTSRGCVHHSSCPVAVIP
jgi:nucleotide-binding universal stress UspA family protein